MTTAHVDPYQTLLDIEAIKQLKARFLRYIDTKQWELVRTLLADDARFEIDGRKGHLVLDSPEQFVEYISTSNALSVHHAHMPEIELIDAANARGIWSTFDYVDVADGVMYQGFGHYDDTFRKTGSTWLLSSFKLTRLRVDLMANRPQRLF